MHADTGTSQEKNFGSTNGLRETALPVMSTGQHTYPLSFSGDWFSFISFPFHTHLPEDTEHNSSLETGQFL